ncbi:VP7 [Araguari virus]|uniref:VP7 n=1 Tax=Araguari virus TaxID=352236 RepID=A0A343FNE6_9ORTO|nr:VP7 [Araguari virus]ASR92129.1 VP7 [Araguari virus]
MAGRNRFKLPLLLGPKSGTQRLRCATLNYSQATHQVMALSGDLCRLLERKNTATSVEARGKLIALRDAFFTDLLSLMDCRGLKELLGKSVTAMVSAMVDKTNPVVDSALDPIQAILIRLIQLRDEMPGLPVCSTCSEN